MTISDEIKPMLVKSRRFLQSAEVLCVQQDYESAVSRIYYAMLYCAEALLLQRDFVCLPIKV